MDEEILRKRTLPESLRYLAGQLLEDANPQVVAGALLGLAVQLEHEQRAYQDSVSRAEGHIPADVHMRQEDVDTYHEVITPGAFDNLRLPEAGLPLTFNWGEKIGEITSSTSDELGLNVTVKLDPDVAEKLRAAGGGGWLGVYRATTQEDPAPPTRSPVARHARVADKINR